MVAGTNFILSAPLRQPPSPLWLTLVLNIRHRLVQEVFNHRGAEGQYREAQRK